jgi:hypothetical protein
MEQTPIGNGTWVLRVLNGAGIALRAQPIDDGGRHPETTYEPHVVVKCDKRIRSPSSGVCFYRVSGTTGWVFDKRGGSNMMELLSSDTATNTMDLHHSSIVQNGWSPDFVRGVAATVDGMEEIAFNEQSRLLSFRSGEVRINVYNTTRTVGTALSHPRHGKTQLFRRDCDVSARLKSPHPGPREDPFKCLSTTGPSPATHRSCFVRPRKKQKRKHRFPNNKQKLKRYATFVRTMYFLFRLTDVCANPSRLSLID